MHACMHAHAYTRQTCVLHTHFGGIPRNASDTPSEMWVAAHCAVSSVDHSRTGVEQFIVAHVSALLKARQDVDDTNMRHTHLHAPAPANIKDTPWVELL